jgi:hypothetical protein
MKYRRSLALAALLVVPLLLSSCKAPTKIDVLWPAATTERSVPRPAGTPRWPLTGMDAPSPEAVMTRIVSVKIENSPGARPQTGLDKADVVYETVTEGGITRFNALFQSKAAKAVGPVRSARPSDFAIVPQYHALFAHIGGDTKVRKELSDRTKYDDMDQFYNPGPYFRQKGLPAPHDFMVDLAKLRAAATAKGYASSESVRGLTFVHATTDGTPTVRSLTVAFSASNKVVWAYDKTANAYRRSINGKPHVDRVTKAQLSARNVVVLWARVTNYVAGKNGQVVEIQLTGTGRASVFRDGQRFDGTWTADDTAPPVLRGADGRVIGLEAGNTWFQVIGNDQDIMMK